MDHCVTGFVTVCHFLVDTCVWPVTMTCVLSLKPDMLGNCEGLTATCLCRAPMLLGSTTLIKKETELTHMSSYLQNLDPSQPSVVHCGRY